MKTYRKTAVMVGILFIIGTVSGILAAVFTAPIMGESTFPLNISASESQWIIGTLLILLMGFPLAMVPVFLYPLLKKHNEVLALGAVVFRGVLEAVCYMGMVISNFLLLSVSQLYGQTGVADTSMKILGSTLISAGDWASLLLGLVFSIGGMMIYLVFYQTKLVPRWLSGWGFIGAILYFIAHIEGIFGSQQVLSLGSGLGFLMIPLAIQEMVFAVWLIVKGFNRTAIAALSANSD
ncbi:MAG: DUF4386 domain-containing protein [Anaerolineaceae bacterium]|nr:DUF4386 domain-containing protein [Anaerolineaceae bacterium]